MGSSVAEDVGNRQQACCRSTCRGAHVALARIRSYSFGLLTVRDEGEPLLRHAPTFAAVRGYGACCCTASAEAIRAMIVAPSYCMLLRMRVFQRLPLLCFLRSFSFCVAPLRQ